MHKNEMTTLCYIENDNSYLMMHRVKKEKDINKDKWIGVGGHFENQESPEECLLREVYEETGLTLKKWQFRGIVTFLCDDMDPQYMHLYTATEFEGEVGACDEGNLEWIPKQEVYDLPIWEGDKIFFRLLEENKPFFSLKLCYQKDELVEAVLDGKKLPLDYAVKSEKNFDDEIRFQRTRLLLGEEAMKKLKNSRVAVFGVGGVGGYVCEALARSGVGEIDMIDHDTVSVSNINRQIVATSSTVGMQKTEVMKNRIYDICKSTKVNIFNTFFLPENADEFPFESYDYMVDAVDTVTAKIQLVEKAKEYHVPIISSMGAGNKLDGSRFQVADIYKTKVCPLAKVMRRELKKRGIKNVKVVYSEEDVVMPREEIIDGRKLVPGSVAFVPSAAGLCIAGEVVRDLVKAD